MQQTQRTSLSDLNKHIFKEHFGGIEKKGLSSSEKVLHGWKETLGLSEEGTSHNTEQMAVVTQPVGPGSLATCWWVLMGDTDSPGGMEEGCLGHCRWTADTDLTSFKATCYLFPFLLGQIHPNKQLILILVFLFLSILLLNARTGALRSLLIPHPGKGGPLMREVPLPAH